MAKVRINLYGLGTDLSGKSFALSILNLFPGSEDTAVTLHPEVTLKRDYSCVPSVLVMCDDPEKVVAVELKLRGTFPEIDIIDPHIRS